MVTSGLEHPSGLLRVAIAQIAPEWLNRERTLAKVLRYTQEAADANCHLVAFGEALVPGYPFWIELTDGARFNFTHPERDLRPLYAAGSSDRGRAPCFTLPARLRAGDHGDVGLHRASGRPGWSQPLRLSGCHRPAGHHPIGAPQVDADL